MKLTFMFPTTQNCWYLVMSECLRSLLWPEVALLLLATCNLSSFIFPRFLSFLLSLLQPQASLLSCKHSRYTLTSGLSFSTLIIIKIFSWPCRYGM